MKPSPKSIGLGLLVILGVACYAARHSIWTPTIELNQGEFLKKLRSNEIAEATLFLGPPQETALSRIEGTYFATDSTGNRITNSQGAATQVPFRTEIRITGESMEQMLLGAGNIQPRADRKRWTLLLPYVLGAIVLGGVGWFVIWLSSKEREKALRVARIDTKPRAGPAKSGANAKSERTIHARFTDVAGAESAKAALDEIVRFFRDPAPFQKTGARIPRGVLLHGPPGTGKTLLARAVAGEAGATFFSVSAASFIELFVGVGAARIRDLFRKAREQAPSIIFIDEIDAIALHRGAAASGGQVEMNQTLNQLLDEMDGFEPSDNVVVIAATNRLDVIDRALLRPGRFDRTIHVPLPENVTVRESILRANARAMEIRIKSLDDLRRLAEHSATFSGAELAAVLRRGAIKAAVRRAPEVTWPDLEAALGEVAFRVPEPQSASDLAGRVAPRVIGQLNAVKALSHSLSAHYRDLRAAGDRIQQRRASKPNVLLFGPSGSGKTWIAECFARSLQVPYATFDAGSLLLDARNFRNALRRLLEAADGNERGARLGVISIFGMERLLTANVPAVQEELARIIEGARFQVGLEDSIWERTSHVIDTSQILFICEATLQVDEESRSERQKKGAVSAFDDGTREYWYDYLRTLGFVPRLLDALPVLERTARLGVEELKAMLSDDHAKASGGESLVAQCRRRFLAKEGHLTFQPEAIEAIAAHTAFLGGSARQLGGIIEHILRRRHERQPTESGSAVESNLQIDLADVAAALREGHPGATLLSQPGSP